MCRASRGGFTLVELLVVVAIVAILGAISVPAIGSLMRAYQLDTTAQIVTGQVNIARQQALSSNHIVEVRFYYLPDYNQGATAAPTVFRGMQCFTEGNPTASGTLTVTSITKPVLFPAPAVLMSSATQSPLLSLILNSADSAVSLPTYQSNYKYVVFHYRPDGSTDLTTTNNSVTLVLENAAVVSNGLPKNYMTIQIDPMIGTTRIFRP